MNPAPGLFLQIRWIIAFERITCTSYTCNYYCEQVVVSHKVRSPFFCIRINSQSHRIKVRVRSKTVHLLQDQVVNIADGMGGGGGCRIIPRKRYAETQLKCQTIKTQIFKVKLCFLLRLKLKDIQFKHFKLPTRILKWSASLYIVIFTFALIFYCFMMHL